MAAAPGAACGVFPQTTLSFHLLHAKQQCHAGICQPLERAPGALGVTLLETRQRARKDAAKNSPVVVSGMSGEMETEGSSLPVIACRRGRASVLTPGSSRQHGLALASPAVAVFPAGFRTDFSGEEIKPRPGPSLHWAAAPLGCPEMGFAFRCKISAVVGRDPQTSVCSQHIPGCSCLKTSVLSGLNTHC